MASHSINITIANNPTGTPTSTDGIMMMFIKAVAVSGTFSLNTCYLLTKLADAEALGITAAYDTTNGTYVYGQVSEFYAQAGDGAYLWLVGVAKATAYATFVASDTFSTLVRQTALNDPAQRAKMIGLCYDVPTDLQSSDDFPADVAATVTALQTAQQALFNAGYQFSCIVDGYNMDSTVTPTTIGTQATNTAFSVSLCITSTTGNGVSQVGMALGRFARISVGRGLGAIADGPVAESTAFLTNSVIYTTTGTLIVGDECTVFKAPVTYNTVTYPVGSTFTVVSMYTSFTSAGGGYVMANCTPVSGIVVNNVVKVAGLTPTDLDALGAKQYLFVRPWQNYPGYYWNDGATCESPTLALSSQEFNRIGNRLAANCLTFFTYYIGSNLPLNAQGNVSDTWCQNMQNAFYDDYINPLVLSGDISAGALTVTGLNFNANRTLNFVLSILPAPPLANVAGVIQFVSTL